MKDLPQRQNKKCDKADDNEDLFCDKMKIIKYLFSTPNTKRYYM
jgi:hypothetical protein